jgi:hypothetical protein
MTAITASPGANAVPIIQNQPINWSGVDPAIGLTPFNQFDPSLGTLDSVEVFVNGLFTYQTLVSPGVVVPQVGLGAQGLPSSSGFTFTADAQFLFDPIINGSQTPIPTAFGSAFTFGFTLDDFTDLVGGTSTGIGSSPGITVLPPPFVLAERENFVEGAVPLPTFQQFRLDPIGFEPTGLTGGGNLQITYNYTPATPNGTVPEPGTLALLALGLIGLAATRRRMGGTPA